MFTKLEFKINCWIKGDPEIQNNSLITLQAIGNDLQNYRLHFAFSNFSTLSAALKYRILDAH